MSLGTLTPEFNAHLFRCRDGSPIPPAALVRLQGLHVALLALLAYARDPAGGNRPDAQLEVLSGWRSSMYNMRVGGAKHSQHVLGTAADITIAGVLPGKVQAWVDLLQRDGRMPPGGLGRYPGFTHVDVRGELARWTGKKGA